MVVVVVVVVVVIVIFLEVSLVAVVAKHVLHCWPLLRVPKAEPILRGDCFQLCLVRWETGSCRIRLLRVVEQEL